MPSLEILTGDAENRSVELNRYSLTIGRATDNDLSLANDRLVSRHHARLLREDAGWFVEDLGSTNGTTVERDGSTQPVVDRTTLHDGDVVVIGSMRARLSLAPTVSESDRTRLYPPPEAAALATATPATGDEHVTEIAARPAAGAVDEPGAWVAPGRRRQARDGGAVVDGPVARPRPPEPAARARENREALQELFLLRLRYREGRMREVGANAPFLLDDGAKAWIVTAGKIDVFAVSVQEGQAAGPRRHVSRIEAGQALFGVGALKTEPRFSLLAVGVEGTRVLELQRERLQEIAVADGRQDEVAALLDGWVSGLARVFGTELPPRDSALLDPAGEVEVEAPAACARRETVWVRCVEGTVTFMGRDEAPLPVDSGRLPISRQTWLGLSGPARLEALDTAHALTVDPDWLSLDRFHYLVLQAANAERERAAAAAAALRTTKAAADRRVMQSTLTELSSVLEGARGIALPEVEAGEDAVFTACRLVGEAQGIAIRRPPERKQSAVQGDPIGEIARASRIRTRDVTLTDGWWKEDNGPLLGYAADGRPVALLPASPSSYEVVDPANGTRRHVNGSVAATLGRSATMFYRAFPDRAVAARELLRFGIQSCRRDLLMIVLVGLAGGVLVTLTPIITNVIFDRVIPDSDRNRLAEVTGALIFGAIAAMLFQLTRGFAVLRVEGRMDATIQSAVWDRLLALPAPFFRHYTTGDLASRALGINFIRQVLSGAAVSSILGVIFSLFNIVVMFYYSPRLAFVAVGLVLIIVLVAATLGYRQIRQQRPLFDLQGRISSLVLELITGVAKLRVAGAEKRAFAVWAREFMRQRRIALRYRTTVNAQFIFDATTIPLTALVIFGVTAWSLNERLSPGAFLGLNAAFTQLLAAMASMTAAFTTVLGVFPVFERLTPILQALPEVDSSKSDPGELSGAIEVGHVSFRYSPDGPLVLNDLSLRVDPGEFVAIVGPSGSGKSSLFRVLLGFEAPESGSVYFDGKELAGLDLRDVRRQTGVVLQSGKLMTGSIYSNIIGSTGRSLQDAWEAARIAGLDADIQTLPMGMYTNISEGGMNFSGGQRQRLMIARAVVTKPRILLFDEATSALDSATQEKVSKNLEGLQATRIVIAHRLSTIQNADRIHVIVAGKVVQSGSYHELLNQPGPFAGLVRRQLA